MKKIVLFIFATITLTSCSKSNEDKAKELIETELQTSMKDWSSYEFVEMSSLDSVFTKFKDSEYAQEHKKKMLSLMVASGDIKAKLKECNKSEEALLNDSLSYYQSKEDSLMNVYKQKENEFKGDFIGYETNFTFRGNNSLGAKVINNVKITFDKDLTSVIEMKSIN